MKRFLFLMLTSLIVSACTPKKETSGTATPSNKKKNSGVTLTGAGATFPFPLYSRWINDYEKEFPDRASINYNSVGSGMGQSQLLSQVIDFGASDTPMNDERLKSSQNGPILHIPTVMGAVVITYNLPGLSSTLKLNSTVLAQIFLGEIEQWNDERIQKLNPDIQLPAKSILVVYRSDGSGTTGVFTDYLAKVWPTWKQTVGTGTAVRWPTGIGGRGNEGVAGAIKRTVGAIGYVELLFAKTNHQPVALIQNSSQQFVEPALKPISDSVSAILNLIPDDFRYSLTNIQGKNAYPISAFTYILMYKKQPKQKGEQLVSFLKWALTKGQKSAGEMNYVPLPESLQKRVLKSLEQVEYQ